jgi:hypothetical protein
VIRTSDPIDLDTLRIRHDFLAVPDLRVSPDSVAASYHIALRHAVVALDALVWEGFLERTTDGLYRRATGSDRR